MSLLDEIKDETRHTGSPCGVQKVLAALNESDAADLRAALADPGIPATNIARALIKRGVAQWKNGDPITRHRRGDCRCDEPR